MSHSLYIEGVGLLPVLPNKQQAEAAMTTLAVQGRLVNAFGYGPTVPQASLRNWLVTGDTPPNAAAQITLHPLTGTSAAPVANEVARGYLRFGSAAPLYFAASL